MVQQHLENQEAVKKLTDLVEEVKICMFATIQPDDTLYSRPMQTIHADDQGNLWFFTNEFSAKVDDVSKDNTVYLMYSHPGKNTYVHVKGKGSIIRDKDRIKEMWSPIVKAWFPKGIEDPALALLQVNPTEASYWDGNSSKFVEIFQIAKAIVKGDTPNEGEFGRLEVNG